MQRVGVMGGLMLPEDWYPKGGTMFLNEQELVILTGRKRSSDQVEWLRERGIPMQQDGRRVLVLSSHVVKWVEGKPMVLSEVPDPADLFHQQWREWVLSREHVVAQAKPIGRSNPSGGGMYFFVEDGEVVYIGIANSFWQRFNAHRVTGRLHSSTCVWTLESVPVEYAEDVEDAFINAWRPAGNARVRMVAESCQPLYNALLTAI